MTPEDWTDDGELGPCTQAARQHLRRTLPPSLQAFLADHLELTTWPDDSDVVAFFEAELVAPSTRSNREAGRVTLGLVMTDLPVGFDPQVNLQVEHGTLTVELVAPSEYAELWIVVGPERVAQFHSDPAEPSVRVARVHVGDDRNLELRIIRSRGPRR